MPRGHARRTRTQARPPITCAPDSRHHRHRRTVRARKLAAARRRPTAAGVAYTLVTDLVQLSFRVSTRRGRERVPVERSRASRHCSLETSRRARGSALSHATRHAAARAETPTVLSRLTSQLRSDTSLTSDSQSAETSECGHRVLRSVVSFSACVAVSRVTRSFSARARARKRLTRGGKGKTLSFFSKKSIRQYARTTVLGYPCQYSACRPASLHSSAALAAARVPAPVFESAAARFASRLPHCVSTGRESRESGILQRAYIFRFWKRFAL